MENRKLEDKIKSVVESNRPLLDHDEIWNSIEPKLKKKKRRRFIVWFLFGIGCLALLNYSKSLYSDQADEALNREVPTLMNSSSKAEKKMEDIEVERMHNENTGLPANVEQKTRSSGVEQSMDKSNNVGRETEPDDQNSNGKEQNNLKTNSLSNERLESFTISGNEAKSPKTFISSNHTPAISANKTQKKNNVNESASIVLKETDGNNSENQLINEANPVDDSAKNNNSSSEDKKNGNESSTNDKFPEPNKVKKIDEKKPIEIKKKWSPRGRWVFELQPFAAPVWAINSIKSNGREAAASYIENRRDAESTLEAYAGGINIRLSNTERKFIVLAGIQYRRLNQRLAQSTSVTTTERVIGEVAVVENLQGEVIETELGQKPVDITTISNFRTYNHYNYFSVPIGIGSKWTERKYSLALMAGIDYNLGFKLNGSILDVDGNRVSFKNGANSEYYNEVYKKSAGIDIWLTAEYARKINRDMYWSIAPKLQMPTRNIHAGDFPASQRFYLFGLDLGLVYLINR